MKNYPNLWNVADLVKSTMEVRMATSGHRWVPARPLGYSSFMSRVKLAWLVFTGKADAVVWPENQ